MIRVIKAQTPLGAHTRVLNRLVYGVRTDVDWDWTHGTEVGLHNVTIGCESINFDFDLKKLWIPPSRWSMMVRQYIDPASLEDCLAKIEERMAGKHGGKKGRGIAVLRTEEHDFDDDGIAVLKTRMVQGRGVGRGVRRRWGSCMLNLSFRSNPVPTVSLHSRTTYFGYLALLDAAVARTFAAECARICRINLADIKFVWTLDLAQFHGFRSLAWMLGDPIRHAEMIEDLPNRLDFSPARRDGNQPGYRKALDGLARIKKSDDAGMLYGDESFSSFARIRRRYHTEVFGTEYADQFRGGTRNRGGKGAFPELPSLMVSDLTFDCLGRSGGDEDDWDDDED